MIDLTNISRYCTSEKVIKIAEYTRDKIKQKDKTYAFVYSGYNGMQFEDENEKRYLELDIEQEGEYVNTSVFILYPDGTSNDYKLKTIEQCIEKWNELF